MSAIVVKFADLQAARASRVDNRTETERLIAQARADAIAEFAPKAFYDGMRAAMESMCAPVPAMLQPRRLAAVQMGGCA